MEWLGQVQCAFLINDANENDDDADVDADNDDDDELKKNTIVFNEFRETTGSFCSS